MSTKYLGDEFDIHGGGLDLIFPHHECELAQARAAGKPFARTWLHWNMITLAGEKMAKSKNHFVSLVELFARHDPVAVRFHMLRSHYRSVSDFSDDGLDASAQGLKRLRESYRQTAGDPSQRSEAGDRAFEPFRRRFAEAMDDDLNTPQAIAVLFDVAREVNRAVEAGADAGYRASAAAFFDELLDGVLGIPASEGVGALEAVVPGLVELLLAQRQAARARRDFAAADALRDRLSELGVAVEDTPEGSRWKLA
jgi:cysteinyl-tRNA synthetase